MAGVVSPGTIDTPKTAPVDIKMECVCTYRSDMGKLLVTDKFLQFRSLHYDEKIPFSSINKLLKKTGGRISVKVGNESKTFGPFDAVRRSTVLETLKACRNAHGEEQPEGEREGGGIDMSQVEGLEDKIVVDVFDEPTAQGEPPIAVFPPSDDKDTVCIDETYPVTLRVLFALLFSDSSKFLHELHEKEGDVDVEVHPWGLDTSKSYHTRLFNFRKRTRLVNCLVHQTQNVYLHSPTELYVSTSNKMEGVPFSECFTVDTKWRIVESDAKCRLQVWTNVNFMKSVSLMRGKIERNSIQGTVEYFKHYAQMIRSKFVGGAIAVKQEKVREAKEAEAKASSTLPYILAGVFAVGFLLFFSLWLWYWWSAGAWTAYVAELEHRNVELENQVAELMNRKAPPPLNMQEKMKHWEEQMENILVTVQALKNEIGTLLPTSSP